MLLQAIIWCKARAEKLWDRTAHLSTSVFGTRVITFCKCVKQVWISVPTKWLSKLQKGVLVWYRGRHMGSTRHHRQGRPCTCSIRSSRAAWAAAPARAA
jgi:hypothetical protein